MALNITRTYGKIHFEQQSKSWLIDKAEPHVCIKLKAIFPKMALWQTQPFKFNNNPDTCADLLWFMERYPLQISPEDLKLIKRGQKQYADSINELERILLPDYIPGQIKLKDGHKGRNYQIAGTEVYLKVKRMINGDDIGLGKTMIAILSMLHKETLPCLVTVQTHLPLQWKDEIEYFTNLRVHIIKGTKPYDLPPADVYITKYSCLAGWVDLYPTKFFKSAVFDEVQELRHEGTAKYRAAETLSRNVEYCLGLSATPLYNYGIELWNIMNVIKPGALGTRSDFLREWVGYNAKSVTDPKALGAYLRENFLMLRRTRKDVGRELPPINTIIHTVPYDIEEVQKAEDIAKILAIKATTGTFEERGRASRELDMLIRHNTGISKARGVAEYVKILLENKVPIILAAWHRDVYDILLRELADYNPVMYTGSESPAEKERSKQAFINGETYCFIISLRSGVGLDGLQEICNTVVIAELDWSGQVHQQIIGRARRENEEDQVKDTLEGKESVTAIYLVADCGSDPPIIDLLGLKAAQHEGIMNPLETTVKKQYTDESRIKLLAQQYLSKQ